MELAVTCYRLTTTFPRHEVYGLASQARRAATSLATKIAEGHARQTRVFRNHVSIALGSQAELETVLELAIALNYLTSAEAAPVRTELEVVGRMLHRLGQALDRRLLDGEPGAR